MSKPTKDPAPFHIGYKFSHGGTVFIDHPDVRISSDEWNLVELALPEVESSIEHDKLLYQKLVNTYVNDTYRNRVDYWAQGFKTLIPLPSPEHDERLAWRDENGRRDAQRYNLFSLAQLRYRAVRARDTHKLILEHAEYKDDELREDEAATMFDAAAQLVAKHLDGTVNLPEEKELANFVDWALDVVGHQFFQDVAPKS